MQNLLKVLKMVSLGGAAVASLFACGQKQASDSDVTWEASREGSQRYAYLWARDFDYQGKAGDNFIFGANVIAVKGFVSAALTASVAPKVVTLKMVQATSNTKKLNVVELTTKKVLMSFDVNVYNNYLEVDFGSIGNDLKIRDTINAEGGASTDGAVTAKWQSSGAPRVVKIAQDGDTLVADLAHTISQKIAPADTGVSSTKSGEVTVRVFLYRQKALPQVAASAKRTVSQGVAKNIGFFGPNLSSTNGAKPIQRFAAGNVVAAPKKIHFYLKNIPAEYQQVAKDAVLSWNAAFDSEIVSVSVAPADVDAGDPRTNVIKWFDGTDKTLGWAGVAKMIVDPDSGLVMGGDLYIQGDTLLAMYQKIIAYTDAVAAQPLRKLEGTLANTDLSFTSGENPIVPFMTDTAEDFASYMQGYYKEVFAHEVGHVLGLRHNFAGTSALDAQGHTASVMDYAPRSERNHYDAIGYYDRAAIRWGYYGEEPKQKLPFCTDENLWDNAYCNQGDFGNPVDYVSNGLIHSTQLLAQSSIKATDKELLEGAIGGLIENAVKIASLNATLTAVDKAKVDTKLAPAYDFFFKAQPASWLSGVQRQVAVDNLAQARKYAKDKIASLQGQRRLKLKQP